MQQGHARARARRSDADSEGERARQRDHPQPVRDSAARCPSRRRCGLRDVVASVMELRQRKLEELGIAIELDEGSRSSVMAIFTELQQVVLNFAINAEQAIVQAQSSDRQRSSSAPAIATAGRGSRSRTPARALRPSMRRSCSSPSTRPSRSARAPASASRSVTTSSDRTTAASATGAALTGGAVFHFELPIVPDEQASFMTQRIYYTEPYRTIFRTPPSSPSIQSTGRTEVHERGQDHQVRRNLAPLPATAGYTGHRINRR